uniref:Uncharacterized protein n=1 Tax=Opuntia streptacantha TaxID=393608 RepID=A0A7C9DP20_OPUST
MSLLFPSSGRKSPGLPSGPLLRNRQNRKFTNGCQKTTGCPSHLHILPNMRMRMKEKVMNIATQIGCPSWILKHSASMQMGSRIPRRHKKAAEVQPAMPLETQA